MVNLKNTPEFLFRSPIKSNQSSDLENEEFIKCLKEIVEKNQKDDDYFCKNEDPHWKELSERYLNVKTQLKELGQLEEQYRKDLIKAAQNKNCEGNGVKLCKIVRKGNIDYKKIPQLQEIDLEEFRSDSSAYWKIQIEEEIL